MHHVQNFRLHQQQQHSYHFLHIHTATHGVGANLCKVGSKRRRTRQEILDDKDEERLKQEGMQGKLDQINALTQRCAELEQKA